MILIFEPMFANTILIIFSKYSHSVIEPSQEMKINLSLVLRFGRTGEKGSEDIRSAAIYMPSFITGTAPNLPAR